MIEYMDRYNIEKAIITTINRIKIIKENEDEKEKNIKDNKDIIEKLKKGMVKGQLSHQDVIELANKAPERFFKFFWFNPKFNPDEEESSYKILENHLKNHGFCGVKIHSALNMFRIPRDIIKLVSFMQEYDKDLILYIHSTPDTSFLKGVSTRDIVKVAERFPDLRILLGHSALCMEYSFDVAYNLKKFKNIYFETSASIPYGIYNIIKTVGHKRVIFGSDSPVASPIQIEIDKILTLPISDEEKQDIFYNNINKLLEFCRK